MKGIVLLNYSENTKAVEEEEKSKFLYSILEQVGIPIKEVWSGESALTISEKIKLREILTAYKIQVIDDNDGGMVIYLEQQKIAEWNKCTYVLKRDVAEIDTKKQLYLEMHVDYWSILQEEK